LLQHFVAEKLLKKINNIIMNIEAINSNIPLINTNGIEVGHDKKNGDDVDKIKIYLWWSVLLAILIGIIMLLLMSLFGYKTIKEGITAFGSGVLIAGGSILCGSFLGFIFGIPSILQDPEARFKYNDNLVQVSDWLTKIIVGVGLTQLYQIPHFVKLLGVAFHSNFGSSTISNDTARNVAIAIMGYYFILGFIMIYFWAKTDYSTVINYMDDAFNKKLRVAKKATNDALEQVETAKQGQQQAETKLQAIAEDKIQVETKLQTVTKAINDAGREAEISTQIAIDKTQEIIKQSNFAGDNNTVDELQKGSNLDIQQKLDALQIKVKDTLPTKTVLTIDDIQKDKWGGKSEYNGKKITAAVKRNTLQSLFDVMITVTNVDDTPIDVPVAIFVHDIYKLPDNVIYVSPNANGKDELLLLAYEGFTIGALFADGTELELDLNDKQLGFPIDFYATK
jgi:hypothetical protein